MRVCMSYICMYGCIYIHRQMCRHTSFMHIYAHIHTYTCMPLHIYTCVHMHMYIHAHMYVCLHHICIHVIIDTHTHVSLHIYHVCIYVCLYIHKCAYTYIHTCLHVYLYMYMHIYIHTQPVLRVRWLIRENVMIRLADTRDTESHKLRLNLDR